MKVTKEKGILSFVKDTGDIATVSLVNGEMREYKFDKDKWYQRKSLIWFFKDMNRLNFKEWEFEDEKLSRFIELIARDNYNCKNMGSFVRRMKENEDAEILLKMGFDVRSLNDILSDTLEHVNKIPKDIIKWLINNKIFDTFVLRDLAQEQTNQNAFRNCINLQYDKNFIRSFIMSDLCSTYYRNYKLEYLLPDIIKEYNLEVKRTVSYVYYLNTSEGMSMRDIRDYWLDYLKMSKLVYNKGKYEKYPKYLRSKHDILQIHYNLYKEEFSENLFTQAYKNYDYEYSNTTDKYAIIQPKNTQQIKDEGRDLSHCVKSYIKDVIDGRTLIYFMRLKSELDTSLITLEIREGVIKQIRGDFNRNPTLEEFNFIKKFAKQKQLTINPHIDVV